jgi:hypothetical protein
MSKLIISPADEAPVKGVESDLDSIGRGNATPIDGNDVVLTIPKDEVSPSRD